MKSCEAHGCNVEFTPNSSNQKYAHPTCRKTLDSLGVCRYRKENGLVEMPVDITSGDTPESDTELRIAYAKLQKEYDKVKNKKDDLVDAVYRATLELDSMEQVKKIPAPPKDKRKGKTEEVAVAVIADWQLAKITPDYNSEICEQRIEQYAQKIIDLTEIQRADHPVKKLHVWA